MLSLQDKVCIITGASRGIGLAIAKIFQQAGAKLVVTAKCNLSALESIPGAKAMKLDLASKIDIDCLVKETLKEYQRIDILVNNAGIFKQSEFETIPESELDEMMNVNFKGPFLLLQQVFAQMKKQNNGKIVNIASGAGIMGSSRSSHYAAAKAGLISLTKSLAKLGGAYGINVNAVAPGFIDTEMIQDMLLKNKVAIESFIPLNRIGSPSDIAGVALYLASANSDYITGQTICVDGGHCMV